MNFRFTKVNKLSVGAMMSHPHGLSLLYPF